MFKNPIKEIKKEIQNWINTNIELLKVKGIRKSVEISSKLALNISIIVFILLGLFFLGIALAFYLGHLLDSTALGFLIVGGFPIVFALIMLLFSKSIFNFLLNFFTRIFTK